MESGATSGSVMIKGKKSDKTRHSWTVPEEHVLIVALKDVVTRGWKSENGFRAGYLALLESAMKSAFAETDKRGNPHINSKIHMWEKQYSCLSSMLGRSGVGWNDTQDMIEATNEAWEALVKVDNSVRVIRYKRWPHYQDWCEIFGNDRATGEEVETFSSAVQDVLNMNAEVPNYVDVGIENILSPLEGANESISVTHTQSSNPIGSTKGTSKKQKQVNEVDTKIVAAINNLADTTKETMSDLIKEMTAESKLSESKISNVVHSVLDILGTILELKSDERVRVAVLLVDRCS